MPTSRFHSLKQLQQSFTMSLFFLLGATFINALFSFFFTLQSLSNFSRSFIYSVVQTFNTFTIFGVSVAIIALLITINFRDQIGLLNLLGYFFKYILLFIVFGIITTLLFFPETLPSIFWLSMPIKPILGLILVFITPIMWYGGKNVIAKSSKRLSSPKLPQDTPQPPVDKAIEKPEEDRLGHKEYADYLFTHYIKQNLNNNEASVIGLNGSWGEGKTSLTNLIKSKVETESDFIYTDFNPWYFTSKDSILSGFFHTIFDRLDQEFILPILFKYKFFRYQKFIQSGLKNFGINLDFSEFKTSNPEKYQDEITSILKKREKTLIVFIDDLDRLPREEQMILVFTLVGLHMDFTNLTFVLSFDREVVERRLTQYFKTQINVDRKYLEKIIDQEVYLPIISTTKRENLLFSMLPENALKYIHSTNTRYQAIRDNLFNAGITNLRDLKRLSKSFSETYEARKNLVNTLDLFFMECIKVIFPNTFLEIQKNPALFSINADWSSDALEYGADYFSKNLLVSRTEKQYKEEDSHSSNKSDILRELWLIEDYLQDQLFNQYSTEKQQLLQKLLQVLFPVPAARFSDSYEEFFNLLEITQPPNFGQFDEYGTREQNLTTLSPHSLDSNRLLFLDILRDQYFEQPTATISQNTSYSSTS